MCINLFDIVSLSEGHEAAEPAPMVVEATLFAKSLSNGNNGGLWSIKLLAYPEDILPSFASLWCVWREDLPKNDLSGPCLHFDGAKLV